MSLLPVTLIEIGAILVFGLIASMCAFLVWHHDYEDGLSGRLALGAMLLTSLAMMALIRDRAPVEDLVPAAGVFTGSVALFMVRHAWRFWCWSRFGRNDWRRQWPTRSRHDHAN